VIPGTVNFFLWKRSGIAISLYCFGNGQSKKLQLY